jgi:hypothetical protein
MSTGTGAVVSALSIADTLIAQYFVAARDVMRSLGDDRERARAIGEANRVYEGIWDHLGAARDQIAALGRDVSVFDQLRGSLSGVATFGVPVVDVGPLKLDVVRSIAGLGLSFSQDVAVRVNLPGAVLAHEACNNLKSLVPEVDWAATRRAQDAEFIDLSSSRRAMGNLIVVVVLAALAALVLWIVTRF